jgi:hypothetical protein
MSRSSASAGIGALGIDLGKNTWASQIPALASTLRRAVHRGFRKMKRGHVLALFNHHNPVRTVSKYELQCLNC